MLSDLKRIRLEQGIKAVDLALKVKVSPSYITLIENNKKVPSREVKRRIAAVLGVAINRLW